MTDHKAPAAGDGVALLSAKMFDFLGDQADLTNEKVARFMTNSIALNVITALIATCMSTPTNRSAPTSASMTPSRKRSST